MRREETEVGPIRHVGDEVVVHVPSEAWRVIVRDETDGKHGAWLVMPIAADEFYNGNTNLSGVLTHEWHGSHFS